MISLNRTVNVRLSNLLIRHVALLISSSELLHNRLLNLLPPYLMIFTLTYIYLPTRQLGMQIFKGQLGPTYDNLG